MNSRTLDGFLPAGYETSREIDVWNRFLDEARYALVNHETKLLREWGRDSLAIVIDVTTRRAYLIVDMIRAAATKEPLRNQPSRSLSA